MLTSMHKDFGGDNMLPFYVRVFCPNAPRLGIITLASLLLTYVYTGPHYTTSK